MATKHPVYGWGFDLAKPIPQAPREIAGPAAPLPAAARIAAEFLPPAGNQGRTPSCWAWSSTYGVAAVMAAQRGKFSTATAANQASSSYAYIKAMEQAKGAAGACTDGHPCDCFALLKQNGGVPTIAAAPAVLDCPTGWSSYGTVTLPPDPRFAVDSWKTIRITGKRGLERVRTVLAGQAPLVYCTSTYTDFEGYRGTPSPYVGNGTIDVDASGKPIGHCMMIVGYDDTLGAVLLLNSWSPYWGLNIAGAGGYVWMAYATFQKLAQGTASYIEAMAA